MATYSHIVVWRIPWTEEPGKLQSIELYQFSHLVMSDTLQPHELQHTRPPCPDGQLLEFTQIHVQIFATPWTVAHQAPLSMGFPKQEYWSGLPFPPPGDLPDPGIKPQSPALQVDSLSSEPPGKPIYTIYTHTHKCWWLSCIQLFVTPWTLAYQTFLFMGFSRQEYWSG